MAGRRRILTLAITIVAAAAVLLLRPKRPGAHLAIGAVRQPATSLLFVARDLGCYDAEHLAVDERTFELGRDALKALDRGEVDVAVAFETPVLRRFLARDDLRVVASLHTSTRNTRIVARRDAGIATMADLRHHRIGAARGTNADFLLETVLTFAGIPRGDVTIVDLPPEAEAEALAAGKVDAAALSDPHAARAAAALGPQAVEIGTELYEEFSFVATRAETLAARSDVLRALVRSLVCADRAAHARPAEAFAAMRRRFPERTEEELRAALARVTWEVALDNRAVAVLRREAEWLSMTGSGGDAEPDVQRLLHPDLLDAADPEAVNLALRP